jgi:chorismate dehydratase
MTNKLRIGKISYVNMYPVFHVLEGEFPNPAYEFVEGYPAELNRMLRDGELDVSPSSSIEYLRHRDAYTYLEGHSISSRGQVRSILLISRAPLPSLAGGKVLATHQSEASTALLSIVLRKFHDLDSHVRVTTEPLHEALHEGGAYLTIGDEALRTLEEAEPAGDGESEPPSRLVRIRGEVFHIYDLGELWYLATGLPFVFALWIARTGLSPEKRELLRAFTRDLDQSRDLALAWLPALADSARLALPSRELLEYWKGIIYGFDGDCREGLERFEALLRELRLL